MRVGWSLEQQKLAKQIKADILYIYCNTFTTLDVYRQQWMYLLFLDSTIQDLMEKSCFPTLIFEDLQLQFPNFLVFPWSV